MHPSHRELAMIILNSCQWITTEKGSITMSRNSLNNSCSNIHFSAVHHYAHYIFLTLSFERNMLKSDYMNFICSLQGGQVAYSCLRLCLLVFDMSGSSSPCKLRMEAVYLAIFWKNNDRRDKLIAVNLLRLYRRSENEIIDFGRKQVHSKHVFCVQKKISVRSADFFVTDFNCYRLCVNRNCITKKVQAGSLQANCIDLSHV